MKSDVSSEFELRKHYEKFNQITTAKKSQYKYLEKNIKNEILETNNTSQQNISDQIAKVPCILIKKVFLIAIKILTVYTNKDKKTKIHTKINNLIKNKYFLTGLKANKEGKESFDGKEEARKYANDQKIKLFNDFCCYFWIQNRNVTWCIDNVLY